MINADVNPHSSDWCHPCGERKDSLADVFYANNAENDAPGAGRPKYVRICLDCAKRIAKIAEGAPEKGLAPR
jgi:hypothetical protein